MDYLLLITVVSIIVLVSVLFQKSKVKLPSLDLEIISREIIKYHNFSSNTIRGFSCYIPDKPPFNSEEGLLLWSYSKTYNRIETQIQKYSSMARIYRMQEMLGLSKEKYADEFIFLIQDYILKLKEIGNFYPIGRGIKLFEKIEVFNLGADFKSFLISPNKLIELELVITNSLIVNFCEKQGYFLCKNKDSLITKKYFSNGYLL